MEFLLSTITPKVEQTLEQVATTIEYDIGKSKFEENKINDPFAQNFVQFLEATLVYHKVC